MSKNLIITGVSKGLGLVIAKTILEKHEQTVIYGVNRSSSTEFEALQKEYPDRLFFKSFDLGKVDDIKQKIFKDFIPKGTVLHGFVNNAAYAYDDIIPNLQLEPLQKMYDVNVFAPMMITRAVLRNFLLHKTAGSIVHISSVSVHTGYKGLAMYASTKGALEAFSKNTAREWGSLGIRSNTIVAGFMETNMTGTLTEDQRNRIYKRTSLKKATSKESVSEMIALLLSKDAASITGQNIHVDSGTI